MRKSIVAAGWLVVVLTLTVRGALPTARVSRPIPAVEHVVVIIVDGLRPDLALLADMPAFRSLVKGGGYTFWAKTTAVAITLPSCTSMLTGVSPAKHGVAWNRDLAAGKQAYPLVPTVFEMATNAGYVTAMVAGKSKFAALNKPGTIAHVFLPSSSKCSDNEVAAAAEKIIERDRPGLMCVHFPDGDTAGHAKGWGSPEDLAQFGRTDTQMARVLAALDRAGLRDSSLVLVSADHGGAGLSHGGDDPRSQFIPWVVAGPGVRKSFDLTRCAGLVVRTEDTCATICWLLGLPQQPYFDGKPVLDAFEPVR